MRDVFDSHCITCGQIFPIGLLAMLSGGPVHQKEIMKRMDELGISKRTCELAKATLPIECIRDGALSMWKLSDGQGNHATTQGDTPFAESSF